MGVEVAVWSSRCFAPNATSQHLLPFPVVIDLVFTNSDESRPSRRVAASRRRTRAHRKATYRRVISSVEPSNRGLDRSCMCRANSFDGLPERVNEEEGSSCGIRKEGEQVMLGQEEEPASKRGAMVSLKSGSTYLDEFRRSSSFDFEDEFFTRMMALESSDVARGDLLRACSTIFDTSSATASGAPLTSASHSADSADALCALGMEGVQLPTSIKKLRRRTGEAKVPSPQEHPRGCAIRNAFSSMVYMIKAVQSHALQIRQALFSEWDVQEVLLLVHREIHSSFLWLFQQVFACTPKLMVSVMLLLANFTVFSMGENVAIAAAADSTPPPIAFFLSTYGTPTSSPSPTSRPNPQALLNPHFTDNSTISTSSAGSGGNKNSAPAIAQSFDGDAWLHGSNVNRNYVVSQEDSMARLPGQEGGTPGKKAKAKEEGDLEKRRDMMKAWVESSMRELKLTSKSGDHAMLEQGTIRRLVAPVVAHLESDNYACFDRTDLEYQLALSKDPRNSLLLANYAQFLYVVRRDHDRAESYFHQAMRADPLDSAILGRFASFLWLGRRNRWAAERAYKAAMAADPDSSFAASNYAHFLWHVGDGGDPSGPMAAT